MTFILVLALDPGTLAGAVRVYPPQAVGTVVPADSAGPPVSSLAALPKGDELIVRYNSSSCHHVLIYDFVFRRDSALSVSVVLVRSGPAGVRTPRQLAILAVADSTAADLDELIRFYREGSPREPGASPRLDLTQVRDGSIIARERWTDAPIVRRFGDYGFSALGNLARRVAPASALEGEYR